MKDKKAFSATIPYGEDTLEARPAWPAKGIRAQLKKIWLYLKGGEKKVSSVLDPAVDIINQISDTQVRAMVKELHFRTPRSLKAMREICEECFILPDDCPYVDYAIFDVNKAVKKMNSQSTGLLNKEVVINELANVNSELAYHLRDYFDLDDD